MRNYASPFHLQRQQQSFGVYFLCAGEIEVDERHRHRYEVNIEKVPALEAQGLKFVGRDTTGERMEVRESMFSCS